MDIANGTLKYKIAHGIVSDFKKDGQLTVWGIEPAFIITVLTVLEILSSLLAIYQACKKTPAQALADMNSPSALSRWRLRKEVRRHSDCVISAKPLEDAIVNRASWLTLADVEQLYKE